MIAKPYLVFLGAEQSPVTAKTALGVAQWAPNDIAGQWRLPGCAVDVGAPDMTPEEAAKAGARSLLLGIAPTGGVLPPDWLAYILRAMKAGLDIVSGLHDRLASIPEIAEAAARTGRKVHDVRHADIDIPIATGKRRTGKRLLTVGTDCALGKKYTALAIAAEMRARGLNADFRATGQTGILIAGGGVSVDAVKADFISGAAEMLSPNADADHWDIIEGQGSLFHPAYAGVTLGLVHGSQPDVMVLCHDPLRRTVINYPDYPLPTLATAMHAYLTAARLTNPQTRFVAVSLNTWKMTQEEAERAVAETVELTGLPTTDPIRFGASTLADAALEPA